MASEEQKSISENQQLTLRQQLFVDAYLGEAAGNASAAARIAGYSSPGQEGHRLLKNAEIQRRIGGVLAESAMSRDEVLERLSRIGRGVMQDFISLTEGPVGLNNYGFRIDMQKAAKAGALSYLRKIKVGIDGTVQVETSEQVRALQLLGQHHRLFGAASGDGGSGGNGEGGKGNNTGPQDIRVEIVYVDEVARQPKGDD